MQEIVLSNDLLQIGIVPETGASLSFFKYKGQDVLRPMNTNDTVQDSNNAALFLMIPFCGRIRGGSFVYWGITRKMKKNQSGIADPIHGDGWKSVWSVDTQTQDSITLKMTHDKATGFPFSYDAGITYALQGPSLSIEMTVTNRAVLPMPVGMGVHPFFVKTKDIELQYQSKTVWAHES
ncbi:MAG: hypothetical protein ACI4QM_02180, partial [Alphaproteobacteria bacterium]